MKATLALAAVLILAQPVPVRAIPVVNGDFEQGELGWTVFKPVYWHISFETSGGNPGGHARVCFPLTGDGGYPYGSLSQSIVLEAGDYPDGALLSFDYRMRDCDHIEWSLPPIVELRVDGTARYSSHAWTSQWKTISVQVSSGPHIVQLTHIGRVFGYSVEFDNVTIQNLTTPTMPLTWSRIKAGYF